MSPVLFLDMDGVVNSARWFEVISKRAFRRAKGAAKRDFLTMIDPAAVALLNAVIDRTGADVVISSSWRIVWSVSEIAGMLTEKGFVGKVIGATPNGAFIPSEWVDKPESEYTRGIEITAWLDEHRDVTTFAIVDDSADMAHLLPRLVRTTWARGIEPEHVERLVALLTTGQPPAKGTP